MLISHQVAPLHYHLAAHKPTARILKASSAASYSENNYTEVKQIHFSKEKYTFSDSR